MHITTEANLVASDLFFVSENMIAMMKLATALAMAPSIFGGGLGRSISY